MSELQHLNIDEKDTQDKEQSLNLNASERLFNLYTEFKQQMEKVSSLGKKILIVIDGLNKAVMTQKTEKVVISSYIK